ncbi:MAG: IS256 family transposase, partial [Nitrososphaera sp.]|nr:IS256 family transposase [Nitrososphaera sp.]
MGKQGLLPQLVSALVHKALNTELTHQLGYRKGEAPEEVSNYRNGFSEKTIKGEHGEVRIQIPRDRDSSFEPKIIKKHQRRFDGFDQKIIAMYGRGMTVREIQGFLEDQYGVEVSPSLISDVTDAIVGEVKEWQQRPLEPMYPIVIFDALRVKIRDEGSVKNKAIYLALGIESDGTKDILGLWIEQSEGAKFWLKIMTDLKTRGVADILIAVVDGLKGFPQAIEAVFPQTQVQSCIVHLTRHALSLCSWQERKEVAKELRKIYHAPNADVAYERLMELEQGEWGQKYPTLVSSWKNQWT